MARPPKIALLIETSSSYGRGLLRGIAQYARLYGPWSLYIEPGSLDGPVPRLEDWGAQGIIALIRTRRFAEKIRGSNVPTVDLDFALPELAPWPVCSDEVAVGRLAADHLLGCGLRNFAFCGWGSAFWWERVRQDAFLEGIRAAGHPCHLYEWPRRRDRTWAREQKHLARWVARLPKPVGVLASNDQRGRHVLEAARLAGVPAPQKLVLMGVDNDEVLCEMSSPSLTSIELNSRRIGFEGAAMLDRLMSGRRPPTRSTLIEPLGLVARQSTDVLAVDDADVTTAVRYIRQNAHRPTRVTDVLQQVAISRKTLEVKFHRALGRTPHEEIDRVRLQRVKDLLVQTDWSLKRIAAASGFTYPEHMHAVFRRQARTTPSRYRALHRGR